MKTLVFKSLMRCFAVRGRWPDVRQLYRRKTECPDITQRIYKKISKVPVREKKEGGK